MSRNPEAEGLVLDLARALHEAGAPTHRIEDAMAVLSPRLGLHGAFFVTPTSIFASFGPPSDERTALVRVEPAPVNLERLDDVNALLDGLARGRVDAAGARARLAELTARPPRYGAVVTVLAFGLAAATVARFLGGGANEIVVAAAIGLQTGLLAQLATLRPAAARLFEWIASFAAAAAAVLGAALVGPLVPEIAAVAGLIVLVPGLTLSVAINELATRHLVSGTARLAGASLTFLAIGLGLGLGSRLKPLVGAAAVGQPVAPLPGWTELAALLLTSFALTVLFRARPRHGAVILVATMFAYATARLVSHSAGSEVGMLAAACVAGLCGNLDARLFRRPAAIAIVPSVLIIIPGTLGVRSVEQLVARDVVPGVELLVTLALLAGALTAGLLFANLILPPRRAL